MTGSPPRENAVLTAALLGLIVCPVGFLIVGGDDLSRPFRIGVLPIYFLAAGFLLSRLLARPRDRVTRPIAPTVLQAVCWIVVVVVLVVVSQVNLLVGAERAGAIGGFFLLAWLICLPVTMARRSALEQRLGALARPARFAILALLFATAAIAVVVSLATPSRFPGGIKGPPVEPG